MSVTLPLKDVWRQIRQAPVVAIVVVASLAVGIGVNASVFSWVQARLFEPLPGVARSASLRLVEPVNDNGLYVGTSWLDYLDLRERVPAFPNLIAGRMMPTYVGDAGGVERVFGMLVSANYFSALRVTPAAGRVFTAADVSVDGREPLAILSWRLAQSRFGAAPSAVGRTLRVNGQVLTVVGVMADEFQGTVLGLQLDVYLPATIAPLLNEGSTELRARDVRGYMVIGHLADGISEAEATRQVSAVMAELTRQYPDTNRGITAQVLPFWQSPRGPQRMMAAA
ncbi:MAG: ABC transporter permease, partial [Vicinamibacterales bacterium]